MLLVSNTLIYAYIIVTLICGERCYFLQALARWHHLQAFPYSGST